jgi:hypothetical protein
MKELELKHLVGYLPYGLRVWVQDFKSDYVGREYDLVVGIHQWSKCGKLWAVVTEGGAKPNLDHIKPILHPLFDLIKESEEIEDSLILQIINSLPNTCGAYIDWLDSCIYNEITPDNLLQAPHELILELQKRHFWIYDQSAFKNGLIVDINTLK